jgi:hypothetical protein
MKVWWLRGQVSNFRCCPSRDVAFPGWVSVDDVASNNSQPYPSPSSHQPHDLHHFATFADGTFHALSILSFFGNMAAKFQREFPLKI